MSLENKLSKLKEYLKNVEKPAVAFSSGVDSTFLLKVAFDVLSDKVVAITARSAFIPKRELQESIDFCNKFKIKHVIVDIDIEQVKHNPKNRCYICKKAIFEKFLNTLEGATILEGSNVDDLGDYRPGMQAIKELNIKSPLLKIGFTKDEIRQLSKELGLSTHNKPSFACLASRFVYGEEITKEKLKRVEKAEDFLYSAGFSQFRVRIHQNIARIEVTPNEFDKILKIRNQISDEFKNYGFSYVTLDLSGYRTGSMNETLK